jgi:hypothetical protein
MLQSVPRRSALSEGLPRYFTGIPCKNGHVAQRLTKNRECIACALARSASDPRKADRTLASARRHQKERTARQGAKYWSDPESSRAYNRAHRANNIEAALLAEAKDRANRRVEALAYSRLRYATNKAAVRAASSKWAKANRAKVAERTARRKAAKLTATPQWVDHAAIAGFYAVAQRMTVDTGIRHEVDHIVPLQGLAVSGLHVPWNLQVITQSANARKRNKLAMIDAALSDQR